MKIEFQVTQDDIEQGRSGPWCPIELALMRIGYKHPRIYATSMRLEKEYAEFPLDKALVDWIYKFDSNEPVEPFTNALEVPGYAVSLPTTRH